MARRHLRTAIGFLALALTACAEESDPLAPSPIPEARVLVGEAPLHLDLTPLDEGPPPTSAQIRYGEFAFRVGPGSWTASVVVLPGSEILVRPHAPDRSYFPLRLTLPWALDPTVVLRAPLLRSHALGESGYVDLLDLVQEFLYPVSGSRIARWETLPVRVLLPPLPEDDPYRLSCREAMERWNLAIGREVLRVVADPDSAQVRCSVFEEAALGYTRALDRDAHRNPLRLVVHLSPRFSLEFPRYIRRAWLHEFGHVLGLWGHSRSLVHLVNGRAVIVDQPHDDEIRALHRLYALPRGFDLSWIDRPWMAPQNRPCPLESAKLPIPWQSVLDGTIEGGRSARGP